MRIRQPEPRFFAAAETCAVVAAIGLLVATAAAKAQSPAQKTFPTAGAAARALIAATRSDDVPALQSILGPDGKELISSGDDVADKNARAGFVKSYDAAHSLVAQGTGKYVLTVGASAWPLPIPIIKSDTGWAFDTAAGKEEILYRRVGRNELETISVCRAIVEAEKQYALTGHDGNPAGLYASRIRSEPGTENGLFWEPKEDAPVSPAGPLLAEAAEGGYEKPVSRHVPFHGYLYRVLTAQGSHAPGGARDYRVDGKLQGFAVIAYPAEYRSSGVMTFLADEHGKLYQKDLGDQTESLAKAVTAFDPDSSWQRVK